MPHLSLMLNRVLGPSVLAMTTAAIFTASAVAEQIPVHLYVRPGVLATIDERTLPALCYTSAPTGDVELPAPVYRLEAGDILEVTLHNQDDAPHGIEVVGVGGQYSSVPPGEASTISPLAM